MSETDDSTHRDTQKRRQTRILDLIQTGGAFRVETLADEFEVSLVTMYRDIAHLESIGLVNRDRGEVTAATSSLSEMPPRMRAQHNSKAKEEIARVAAKLIHNGNSLMVDDSSSVIPFIRNVLELRPLTIITNAQAIARMAEPEQGVNVIATGGEYYRWGDSYHGSMTVAAIKSLHADYCVTSDAAVMGTYVCNPYGYVVETKRAMLEAADKRILLVDSTKFTRRALHTTAPLSQFNIVIVDEATTSEDRELIRNQGCELIVADSL